MLNHSLKSVKKHQPNRAFHPELFKPGFPLLFVYRLVNKFQNSLKYGDAVELPQQRVAAVHVASLFPSLWQAPL